MIPEGTLLMDAGKDDRQRRDYDKTTRLKTGNRLGSSSVAGCLPKRLLSSLFSAHYDKSTATVSGAAVLRAAVERRRATRDTTTTMPETSSSMRRDDVNKTSDVYRTDSVNRENHPESSLEPPLQVIVNMLTALLTCKHSAGGWV